MNSSSIIGAMFAGIVVLSAAYVWSLSRQSADLLVVQATSADFSLVRTAASWALGRIEECPYADFLPTTPYSFVISAWQPAAREDDIVRVLQHVHNMGCAIDKLGTNGLSALHNAVLFNNPDAVRELLLRGADPEVRTAIIENPPPIRLPADEFAHYLDQVSGEDRGELIKVFELINSTASSRD